MTPEQREQVRILEARIAEGMSPEEEAKHPADLISLARENLRAKIQEGLDALDRGEFVDGEAFFDGWKSDLRWLAGNPPDRAMTD